MTMLRKIVIGVLALAIIGGTGWYFMIHGQAIDTAGEPTAHEGAREEPPQSSDDKSETTDESFKKTYSLTDPESLWVIVNKQNPLPDGYKPADLVVPDTRLRIAASNEQMQMRKASAAALEQLIRGASSAQYSLALSSGFRSEALQRQFYTSYTARDGQAAADTYSARPGFSEHQTGLVADLGRVDQKCQLATCFGELPEGRWLATHAHEYGFVIRYLKGKEPITGYQYEPWHVRYVGIELATKVHAQATTLEEYFGLPPAPDYD